MCEFKKKNSSPADQNSNRNVFTTTRKRESLNIYCAPRDSRRSRVLSDRKVLFHRGFRGDETGVTGDDGHSFSSSYDFWGKFPREREEWMSHKTAEDFRRADARERERTEQNRTEQNRTERERVIFRKRALT